MRASAGAAGELWLGVPASESAIAIFSCCFGLGGFAGPPDEPEGAEDWNLQHDEQKENGPEPLHAVSVPTPTGLKAIYMSTLRPIGVKG